MDGKDIWARFTKWGNAITAVQSLSWGGGILITALASTWSSVIAFSWPTRIMLLVGIALLAVSLINAIALFVRTRTTQVVPERDHSTKGENLQWQVRHDGPPGATVL